MRAHQGGAASALRRHARPARDDDTSASSSASSPLAGKTQVERHASARWSLDQGAMIRLELLAAHQRGHDGFLNVETILRLVPHDALRSVDDVGRNFLTAVRGEAV